MKIATMNNIRMSAALAAAVGIAACASTPQPNPALESARTAVQTASADPNVNRYAALDLEAAKSQLAAAEDASLHRKEALIAQPAYLATQNARLAQAHAAAKADDARVSSGQAERDQIMLSARTREAERAKANALNAQAQASAAQQETARVQAELDALKAQPTPRGQVLTLGDVLFDTGRAELKSGAARKMDQLAQFLSEHPDRRVQVDGFTDSVGTDDYNQDLSQRRADSVKSALLFRGVPAERVSTTGYGKAFPVASNTDSGGRQLNRRVEVVIGNDTGAPIAPRS